MILHECTHTPHTYTYTHTHMHVHVVDHIFNFDWCKMRLALELQVPNYCISRSMSELYSLLS
jgi:hypothetical protein